MTIELKTAKYKGVEFLYEEMETKGGNRNIGYTFPGSDSQAVERQGKIPRTFTILAIIPHENYYKERDDILRVLEDGKKGTLSHPTFGDIPDVVAGEYTLTEKITELGRATIEATFTVDNAKGVPDQSGNLASQVQKEADLLNGLAVSDLADGFNVTAGFFGNLQDAIESGLGVFDALESAADGITAAADLVAGFQASVDRAKNRIYSLVTAPADLADTIYGLAESLNNLADAPGNALGAMKALAKTGDDDPVINPTTSILVERKRNRDLLRTNVKTLAMSFASVSIAEISENSSQRATERSAAIKAAGGVAPFDIVEDAARGTINVFSTTEQVEKEQADLEAQYLDLRDNQLMSNEAQEQMDRLRVQSQALASDVLVNTKSIITIETRRKPLSVLLYEYYGNTDLFDVISDLNNIKQNAFVEGEIKILSL